MAVRNQADRFWYQMEIHPVGENRRFMHLDLEMIDHVNFMFGPPPTAFPQDELFCVGCQILTNAKLQPIEIENWPQNECYAAHNFYQFWISAIELEGTTPAATPSLIQVASNKTQYN